MNTARERESCYSETKGFFQLGKFYSMSVGKWKKCTTTEAIEKTYSCNTVWIDQNGQNEIMAFLACLFDANQLLL